MTVKLITADCICLLRTAYGEALHHTVQHIDAESKRIDKQTKTSFYIQHTFADLDAYIMHVHALFFTPNPCIAVPHPTQDYSMGLHTEVVKTTVNMRRSHRSAPVAAV